jgi:hypothetical protein
MTPIKIRILSASSVAKTGSPNAIFYNSIRRFVRGNPLRLRILNDSQNRIVNLVDFL